jgi:hypothetical protein
MQNQQTNKHQQSLNTPQDKVYIYESPDKGKTIYRREFGKLEREKIKG